MYIPPGFNTIAPYVFVAGADEFITFLCDGLGGRQTLCSRDPDGRIANAQVAIGTSTLMITEATKDYGPMAASYYLYVADADATMQQALASGAELVMPVSDQPYGDRQGGIRDEWGNLWWISQRLVEEPYTA